MNKERKTLPAETEINRHIIKTSEHQGDLNSRVPRLLLNLALRGVALAAQAQSNTTAFTNAAPNFFP